MWYWHCRKSEMKKRRPSQYSRRWGKSAQGELCQASKSAVAASTLFIIPVYSIFCIVGASFADNPDSTSTIFIKRVAINRGIDTAYHEEKVICIMTIIFALTFDVHYISTISHMRVNRISELRSSMILIHVRRALWLHHDRRRTSFSYIAFDR